MALEPTPTQRSCLLGGEIGFPELMTANRKGDSDVLRRVQEIQAGTAVEANSRFLFERYYRWVRGFFERRGHPPEEAEDLAQETFLQLFREIASFRGDSPFESWLFAVAANLLRNERRSRKRKKRDAPEVPLDGPGDLAGGPGYDPPAGGWSPARAAFERERQEALGRALQALPPQMRQCLALRLGQELKYREIATLLKISVETVKAHLFQARRRLRAELGEQYGEWRD